MAAPPLPATGASGPEPSGPETPGTAPAGRPLRHELPIFIAVGVSAVIVDSLVYWLTHDGAGLAIWLAKACGYVAGACWAYLCNRLVTFRAKGSGGAMTRFALLYGTTLMLNVLVNEAALAQLGTDRTGAILAFLVATGVSAVLNFLGLKFLVFRTMRPRWRPR